MQMNGFKSESPFSIPHFSPTNPPVLFSDSHELQFDFPPSVSLYKPTKAFKYIHPHTFTLFYVIIFEQQLQRLSALNKHGAKMCL